jgi:3-hydroxyisobutyrate dehydrogenase
MDKIGMVGVGRMGANMARRLKDCGYAVVAIYDTGWRSRAIRGLRVGRPACNELAEVTRLSMVVLTVVSDDRAMKQIFTGGLLRQAKDRLFINARPLRLLCMFGWNRQAEKAKAQSLEACMASSITQAREGTLYLMCGGRSEGLNGHGPYWRSWDLLCVTSVVRVRPARSRRWSTW